MCNFIPNEQGGLTYASEQRIGEDERRHAMLGEVRMIIEGLTELCAKVREYWPERYPIPPELEMLLNYQDYALARARSGELKRFAEICES